MINNSITQPIVKPNLWLALEILSRLAIRYNKQPIIRCDRKTDKKLYVSAQVHVIERLNN